MPSYVTPKIGTQFIYFKSLVSQADANLFQVAPTLAAGDVTVSTDGGALNNITTLPVVTPAGGRLVMVTLSAAEMNGDNVDVVFSDVAGAEWQDQTWNIQTTTQQIDDIPTDADIADAVWDEAMAGHAVAGTFGESVTDGATDTAGAVWDELMAGHD